MLSIELLQDHSSVFLLAVVLLTGLAHLAYAPAERQAGASIEREHP
ncbi:MAG: hypothetical protein ABWY06_21045 [Pseudomonas sp.]